MIKTDLTISNLNHYIYCPFYYKHTINNNIYSKRTLINNGTRQLFAWCFYELTTGTKKLKLQNIENKAYKDLFPDVYSESDMSKYPSDILKLIDKINNKSGDYDIIAPSVYYPFAVSGILVSCPIDLIINSKNKSHCSFFILDFNDKYTINATQNLYMPSVVIPYNVIPTYFTMPRKQIKIYSAKLSSSKLSKATEQTSGQLIFKDIESIVSSIKLNNYYRRVSANCENCIFNKQCFTSNGDSINDN
jgi:hypothetical protein